MLGFSHYLQVMCHIWQFCERGKAQQRRWRSAGRNPKLYRVAAYSNVGLRKKTNQDSCCAEVAVTPFGDVALLSVCDGVGGLSAGELASSTVIHWLVDWFEFTFSAQMASAPTSIDALFDLVQSQWEDGLITLNKVIRSHGRAAGAELGTTCTVMLLIGGRYLIGHVGDCRVYRFANGGMNIITADQTWVAREVARGNITPEQARNHQKKNVILQSVGTQTDLMPVFYRGEAHEGDVYMVCCDGFRNELFDDELLETYGPLSNATTAQLYAANERLANIVMDRQERDNITAVACTYHEGTNYDLSHPADTTVMMGNPIVVEQAEQTTRLDIPSFVTPNTREGDTNG